MADIAAKPERLPVWVAVHYLCANCAHRWNQITPKNKRSKKATCPDCKKPEGLAIRTIEELD